MGFISNLVFKFRAAQNAFSLRWKVEMLVESMFTSPIIKVSVKGLRRHISARASKKRLVIGPQVFGGL